MIELVIDNEIKTINSELTVSQFQKYIKEQDKFNSSPSKMLSLLLDMDEDDVKDLPKNQVDFVLSYVNQKFMEPKQDEIIMTFEHDGVTYGLENDWGKLSWGAWVDIEILSAEKLEENIHHILAILYRPVTKTNGLKYEIEPYASKSVNERKEIFKDLPISIWFSCSSFFFLIAKLYISDINNSLKWIQKMKLLMLRGWMILPKFLQKKVPVDSILRYSMKSRIRILPNLNR